MAISRRKSFTPFLDINDNQVQADDYVLRMFRVKDEFVASAYSIPIAGFVFRADDDACYDPNGWIGYLKIPANLVYDQQKLIAYVRLSGYRVVTKTKELKND